MNCNCGCHEEMTETCDLCCCKEGTLDSHIQFIKKSSITKKERVS